MFTIYHSNSPELFTKLIIDIISNQPLYNPMQSEIILIENKIMERWLEGQLANYFGIASNIVFIKIRSFIKKISSEIFIKGSMINNFTNDFMYWKFIEILSQYNLEKNYSIIQQYLNCDINQRKCGQLSEHLTNLFTEYLIYRSDWLNTWQSSKIIDTLDLENQIWQSAIWRMFLKHTKKNILQEPNLFEQCISILKNNIQKTNYKKKLPQRIFIYGITNIPPMFWEILDLLSYHLDIYLWNITPFTTMKKYIFNYKILHNNQNKHLQQYDNKLCLSVLPIDNNNPWNNKDNCYDYYSKYIMLSNHFLLHLWGKIGKDTLFLINQLKNTFEIKAFITPQSDSMLHILQKNILESQYFVSNTQKKISCCIKSNNKKKYILQPEDESISIHICNSMQREIEVLHDHLLLILSNDPSILLGEILVVAPNIHNYISIIETVFNNIFNRQLPFAISSNYSKYYTHPIISSILKILEIPHIRFTSEEVLSLLSIPFIASKFNIKIEEISLLRQWIIESGIRWGLDEETMNNFNLSIVSQNTWDFGFKRMLLGYAIHGQDEVWENFFPYEHVNENNINIISQLGQFLKILYKWRSRLNSTYKLEKWIPVIQEIIDDFFCCRNFNDKDNKVLFFLKNSWVNILESGMQSGYSKVVSLDILKDRLNYKLTQKKINCQFSMNVINFCDITSISYIPYKILCCIGMNNDAFPRHNSCHSFNLILQKSRYGDNNIREKDCYSFLLAILLAKKQVYISFIEQSLHYGDTPCHQSILIDELLEYIAQNFYLEKHCNLDIADNIMFIHKYLLQWHTIMPFDFKNFLPNTRAQSFAQEWLKSSKTNIDQNYSIYSNYDNSLSPITVDTILFQDLYKFYQHPVRTWFQKRLGVYFYQNKYYKQLLDDEPFFTDDLFRLKINTKLIHYLINNKSTDNLYYQYRASGALPYGEFGKLFWMKKCEQMNKLANQIKPYYSSAMHDLNISLMFNKIKLIGQLHSVQKNGLTRWKPFSISMKDCFLLWLEHLIYCALGGSGDSRLFSINDIWHFPNFSRSKSQALLSSVITGYCIGMNTPLILLYKTGGIWMHQVFDWNSKTICSTDFCQNKARIKLIQTWEGNNKFFDSIATSPENRDPYLRKLIPLHLRDSDIQKIIETSKYYFLNIMKYRVL